MVVANIPVNHNEKDHHKHHSAIRDVDVDDQATTVTTTTATTTVHGKFTDVPSRWFTVHGVHTPIMSLYEDPTLTATIDEPNLGPTSTIILPRIIAGHRLQAPPLSLDPALSRTTSSPTRHRLVTREDDQHQTKSAHPIKDRHHAKHKHESEPSTTSSHYHTKSKDESEASTTSHHHHHKSKDGSESSTSHSHHNKNQHTTATSHVPKTIRNEPQATHIKATNIDGMVLVGRAPEATHMSTLTHIFKPVHQAVITGRDATTTGGFLEVSTTLPERPDMIMIPQGWAGPFKQPILPRAIGQPYISNADVHQIVVAFGTVIGIALIFTAGIGLGINYVVRRRLRQEEEAAVAMEETRNGKADV